MPIQRNIQVPDFTRVAENQLRSGHANMTKSVIARCGTRYDGSPERNPAG